MPRIRPLEDRLYILPMSDPTEFGLIQAPNKDRRRPDQGIVQYRGPDTTGDVPVGSHVLFSHWAGDEIVVEDIGRWIILRERDVHLVIEEDASELVLTLPRAVDLTRIAFSEASRQEDPEHQKLLLRVWERIEEHFETMTQREMYF